MFTMVRIGQSKRSAHERRYFHPFKRIYRPGGHLVIRLCDLWPVLSPVAAFLQPALGYPLRRAFSCHLIACNPFPLHPAWIVAQALPIPYPKIPATPLPCYLR
jgi:hypothetical protein